MSVNAIFKQRHRSAGQSASNCTADQHLCFPYMDSSTVQCLLLLCQNFQACDFTGRFVSLLVRKLEDHFSCAMAQMQYPVNCKWTTIGGHHKKC